LFTQPELARRWLETARRDLLAARNCVDGPHFLPGIAAYHCQQAGEKLVKAVLIHRGIEPMRSHDIDMRSTDCRRPTVFARSWRLSVDLRLMPLRFAIRGRMPTPAPRSGKKSAIRLPRSTRWREPWLRR
jgi:hypothetical protein